MPLIQRVYLSILLCCKVYCERKMQGLYSASFRRITPFTCVCNGLDLTEQTVASKKRKLEPKKPAKKSKKQPKKEGGLCAEDGKQKHVSHKTPLQCNTSSIQRR